MTEFETGRSSNAVLTARDADGFALFEAKPADEAKFEENLRAFELFVPWLMPKINALKSTTTKLVVNIDRDFDISFEGEKFFQGGSRKWAAERVDNFEKKPFTSRLTAEPVDTENLDDVSNEAIFQLVKRAVQEEEIKFAAGAVDLTSYHFVVLGVGLADHLPLLIERTDCRNLILFEPNIEFLYHSLFTFDWAQLFEDYNVPGKRIFIFNEKIATDVAIRTRDAIRLMGSHFAEGTFIFRSYPSTLLEQSAQEILADAQLIVAGMGFLEDEFDMVRNAHQNLRNFRGQYYKKCYEVAYMPAFVVGSGPSLDMNLSFLRANQGNAVIISCGTGIRILMRNGIRPDIHVEMENSPLVPKMLEDLSKDHDLSNTILVAATVVGPQVQTLFKKVILFVRPSLTSTVLFDLGEDAIIDSSSPTVSNLGFSLACELGFQSIYLFGVDLGARNPEHHHASDVIYNTGDFGPAGVTAEEINTPVPANFGGTVFSEFIFLWSKDMIETKAARYQGRRQFYNCSDGVRIEGITPKLSSAVELSPQPKKIEVIDTIFSTFPFYSRDHFENSWNGEDLKNKISVFRDKLLKCCDREKTNEEKNNSVESQIHSPSPQIKTSEDITLVEVGSEQMITDFLGNKAPPRTNYYEIGKHVPQAKDINVASGDLDFLVEITHNLLPRINTENANTEIHFFRGSMFMMMIAIYYYTLRVPKGKKRDALIEIGRQETVEHIKKIADFILTFYNWIDGSVEKPPPVGAYRNWSK